MPSRWRMPREYVRTLSAPGPSRPTASSASSTRRVAAAGAGRAEHAQVVAARQVGVERGRLDERADPEQPPAVAPRYGWPSTSMVPAVGRMSPTSMRRVVVLPEPLGPRKP